MKAGGTLEPRPASAVSVVAALASRPSDSYKESLSWLYGLQRFGIKLGLENIQRLINALELTTHGDFQIADPDFSSAVPRRRRVIHVAGTNGKGSVSAMLDAICRAQGYNTGLFISPHLVTFRERIRVNGQMISEKAVARILNQIRALVQDWDPHPTFFEITTALGLKHFSESNVDIAILETGLGGRLDATNAVASDVAVITPIDLDHEEWLGDSLEKIAAEKAGIIKKQVPVVSAIQQVEVENVIRDRADQCASDLRFVDALYDRTPIALRGSYQKQNAGLAIAALAAARIAVDDVAVARGLMSMEWPARFQRWDDRMVIDGAHNPAAARLLAETWRENFGGERATIILAVLSDKDALGICQALTPISDFVFLPKIRSERAADPEALAKVLSTITPSLPHSVTPSIASAIDLARAKLNRILLTGSLHFAGEVIAHLGGQPAAFEECAQ